MRVALFTETYLPQINGVVTHVKILKEGLEKLGHTVLVVAADANARHHFVQDGVLHCPARVMKRFYGFGVASPISQSRLKILKEFRPDIIHIHNEFGIGLSGVAIAKILKVPLVYTLHTMYDDYIYYIAPKPFIKIATRLSHRYTHILGKAADELTGPSKKCVEYFRHSGIYKPVSLIPNSAELDAFSPSGISQEAKAQFRRQYHIPEDVMLACFVGRLGQEKSVDVLLQFYAQTIKAEERIWLLIIGDGPERENLENLAQSLQVADRVIFTGRVEHPDLPPYVASCDVFATASLSEMNSISMLEAMATGLLVLQRFDELNADQIHVGENGYFFRTAEEMAQRLRYVKGLNPQELAQLKERVIGTVRQSGAEDIAHYMLGVYQRALEDKKEGRGGRTHGKL